MDSLEAFEELANFPHRPYIDNQTNILSLALAFFEIYQKQKCLQTYAKSKVDCILPVFEVEGWSVIITDFIKRLN